MALQPVQHNPPANHQDFERWCVQLFRRHLNCPSLQPFGRSGQKQGGIDLVGIDFQGQKVAVQCKLRASGTLAAADIDADVAMALREHTDLHRLVLATTARRDTSVHRHVLDLDKQHRLDSRFAVEVCFWEDIEDLLNGHGDVASELTGIPDAVSRQFTGLFQSMLAQHPGALRLTHTATAGSERTELDEEIDAAFEEGKAGRFREAIGQLEILRKLHWQHVDARLKYRLLANTGNIHFMQGDIDRAADLWLEARDYRNSPSARSLEARAHWLKGNLARARELVDGLIAAKEELAEAYALKVQLSRSPYESTLAEVPESFLAEPEVSAALAYSALGEYRLAEAESHLRTALAKQHCWPAAQANLAAVIAMRARELCAIGPDDTLVGADPARVDEAIAILEEVLEQPSELGTCARALALLNRAALHRMCGRHDRADDDLAKGYQLQPNEPKVAVTYAGYLAHRGRDEEAIKILRNVKAANKTHQKINFLLAIELAQTGDAAVVAEAIQALEQIRETIAGSPLNYRLDYAWLRSRLEYRARPASYSAQKLPTASVESLLPEFDARVLGASWVLELGDRPRADREAGELMLRLPAALTEVQSLRVGYLMARLRRFSDATAVMRGTARRDVWCETTKLLLSAAHDGGDYATVIEWTGALWDNGARDRRVLQLSLDVRSRYNDYETCAVWLRDWLATHPDDAECWLWLGIIGVDGQRPALIRECLEHMPPVEAVQRRWLWAYVQLIPHAHPGASFDALIHAYRLWRRFKDSVHACSALVLASMSPRQRWQGVRPAVDVVGAGTTAIIKLKHKPEPLEITIETDSPHDLAWREFAADHPHARAVLGKRVGDQVLLGPDISSQTGMIQGIVPSAVWAAGQCAERWNEMFPDTAFIAELHTQPIDESSSPEQIREALSPLIQTATARRDHSSWVLKRYANELLPTWYFAQQVGLSQWRAVETILDSDPLELRSKMPQVDRGRVSVKAAESASEFVLDTSAFVVLARLGLLETVTRVGRLIFPELLRLRVNQDLAAFGDPDRPTSYMLTDGEHVQLVEQSRGEIQTWHDCWSGVLQRLGSLASFCSGMALAKVEPQVRKQLEGVIGPVDACAVAAARAQSAVLLSDDVMVHAAALDKLGAQVLSSIDVLELLAVKEIINQEQKDDALASLIGWRVQTIGITFELVRACLVKAGWDPGRAPAKMAIEAFGAVHNDPLAIAHVLVQVCTRLWRAVPRGVLPERILGACLTQLGRRADGRAIGMSIAEQLDAAFGLDVTAAHAVKTHISRWAEAPSGIVLPGGRVFPP